MTPDTPSFEDLYWNPAQVVSWIFYRNPTLVDGQVHIVGLAAYLDLNNEEFVDNSKKTENPHFKSISDAKKELLRALTAGELVANGLPNNEGDFTVIPAIQWAGLNLYDDDKNERDFYVYAGPKDLLRLTSDNWYDIIIPKKAVLYLWPEVVATRDGDKSSSINIETEKSEAEILSVFQQMDGLNPSEVEFQFVEGGLVNVSARGSARRVPYASLGLVNRRNGELNKRGTILLGMAKNKRLEKHPKGNSKEISRLRTDLFKNKLGIMGDPFQKDWAPHFSIKDHIANLKRKAQLETNHQPFNEDHHMAESTGNFKNGKPIVSSDYSYDPVSDDDPAAEYLK